MTAPDPTAAAPTSSPASGTLAAVLVCGGACCSGEGDHAVLDALAPLVRSPPHALLVRTTCLHPHDACPRDHGACPHDHGACALSLQLCERAPAAPVGLPTAGGDGPLGGPAGRELAQPDLPAAP